MSITFTTKNAAQSGCELNVSNANALAVFTLCGIPVNVLDNGHGDIKKHQFPGVIMGCAMCLEGEFSDLVQDVTRDGNVIECGRSADQVKRYAVTMLKLVSLAIAQQSDITFY